MTRNIEAQQGCFPGARANSFDVSRGELLAHDVLSASLMTARLASTCTPVIAASEWSDDELLGRMLLREGRAWREFHRRFDRLVYRCIHKVTSRFRSVVGEEDVQEIYAQFQVNITARDFHKLRKYAPDRGSKFGSWIGLLATNTAWDYLRAIARRPNCTDLDEAAELTAGGADPYDKVVEKERWNLVSEVLVGFSSRDRHFVQLYFMDGLTPEEVAAELDVSVKTVYSKKHKIRCRLEREVATRIAA